MAFIYKELIQNNYNNCADLLDKFDYVQINTVYSYLKAINIRTNHYEMMSSPSRTAILVHLVHLKENKNECAENILAETFHSIFIFMTAVALLKANYMTENKLTGVL